MSRLFYVLVLFVVFPGVGGPAVPVDITVDARSFELGEICLLTVRTARPDCSVTGQVFGTEIHFYQTEQPEVWQALIGLDLDLPPGEHEVAIKVRGEFGEDNFTRTLHVAKKVFATRFVSVPQEYVSPPGGSLERIQREAEEVKAIFSITSPGRLWKGTFLRPVPGRVVSGFGKRSVYNEKPLSVHSGVDLRAPIGTPLRAPAGGRVVLAKELYFAGNAIILDHGLGLFSYFAHLSKLRVKEGETVRRGQVIGLTGKTGRVQGPHLHWSMRLGNARVDPMALLNLLKPSRTQPPKSEKEARKRT